MIRLLGYAPLHATSVRVAGREIGAAAMSVFRQHRHPGLASGVEAGGVMLGRYVEETQVIAIDEATEPAPLDERMPATFHRLDGSHAEVVVARWRESAGRVHYIGEWHTHAEPRPTPSMLDMQAWRDTLHDDARVRGPLPLLFIIVGQSEVGLWEGRL